MTEKISKLKYFFVTLVLCLTLIFNFLQGRHLLVGLIFGGFYLIFYSFIFSSLFIEKRGWQLIFGLLFLLALIAIFGAGWIYLYQFNDYLFILLILVIPGVLIIPYYQVEIKEKFSLKRLLKGYLDKFTERQEPKINILLILIYLLLTGSSFGLLFLGQTDQSIQAPWQVVNRAFLPLYFFASAVLLVYLLSSFRTKLPLALTMVHTFLSSSVALIVYKIGYGFDPFIHQATEKIIAQTGTISPKPLYYLGQYAIVVFLNKLTLIDISLIDRFLVPVLFSVFLPTITFFVFSHWLRKNYALALSLIILVIPYSGFIMTAPQNLANLLFIITILLSLLYFRNLLSVIILYLLTAAVLAIHPLAGLPLLITVFLLHLFKVFYKSYNQYLSLYFFTSLVFVFTLPLAFLANGSDLTLTWPDFTKADFFWLGWVDKFDLPLNLAYLFNANKIFLAGLVIIIGLIYIGKNKLLKNNAGYLIAAFIIFANFFLTKYFISFPALQNYDKADFVKRLLILAFYVLLPFFLLGLYWLIKTFWKNDIYHKIFLVFGLAGAMTISLYFSYPRLNQYEPAKFFSLSASDIKAVNLIEQIGTPNHIVLSNQMIGAAAIKEFGFKKYYNNQFYYSMPMGTTQTFYSYYLEMVYQGAKKETMQKAMAEAQVEESYFVINKYWGNFEKIVESATASADQVYNIDNGKIYIFQYLKDKDY
ncbi:MAG: hypothetical protein WCW26_01280 [Candidatus Buchananbacteria bacterium]